MIVKNKDNSVYIVDGLRTPIGSPHRSLKNFTATQLASEVIKEIIKNSIDRSFVDQVVMGNVVSSGLGQSLSRQAALSAGLADSTNCFTVNNVCGSGLQSLISSVQSICLGDSRISICGGAESATHSPYFLKREKSDDFVSSDLTDSINHDGLYCHVSKKRMGDLVEGLADEYDVSRREQDQFAFESHMKACNARDEGFFADEIVSVKASDSKVVNKDDRPRQNINLDRLKRLPSVFKMNGSITAGNSSIPCDGASALLLTSDEGINNFNGNLLGRILDYAVHFVHPDKTFESSLGAIDACLKKCSLTIDDIDLFEICESFAAQALFVKKELNISMEKMNISGGDIALGHPLGSAGTRILVTLLHALKRKKLKCGLACVSFGGGGAICIIVENV